MKTAIYIEDGVMQLVLTPEDNFERECLAKYEDEAISAKIMLGSFYDCRGGWIRQAQHHPQREFNKDESSLIIQMREQPINK